MVWFDWSVRMINGRRKSFQAHSAVRMAMVALIGLISGKMMVQKMRHVDAPSIRAASSSETGIARMKPVAMNRFVPRPSTVYRMIRPTWLSRCREPICFAIGSMTTGNGTNMAAMKK